jgi:hypothetical protein
MPPPTQHDFSRRLILWLVVALSAWGAYHALGAFLFNHDVRRGLVVLACVGGFLAFWLTLLKLRSRRQAARSSGAG